MRSEQKLAIFFCLAVAIAASVAVSIGAYWFIDRARDMDRYERVEEQLTMLRIEITCYAMTHGRLPASNLAECMDYVKRHSDWFRRAPERYSMLLENRDAWGHRFILDSESSDHRLIVRSVGANGIDDRGKGDDVMISVEMRPEWKN